MRCEYCNATYRERRGLGAHMARKHGHVGSSPSGQLRKLPEYGKQLVNEASEMRSIFEVVRDGVQVRVWDTSKEMFVDMKVEWQEVNDTSNGFVLIFPGASTEL